jgi:hypothetical protein
VHLRDADPPADLLLCEVREEAVVHDLTLAGVEAIEARVELDAGVPHGELRLGGRELALERLHSGRGRLATSALPGRTTQSVSGPTRSRWNVGATTSTSSVASIDASGSTRTT